MAHPLTNHLALPIVCFVLCFVGACDKTKSSQLKGESNATLTFFAKAVDQDGNPLPGIRITYRCESFPKDWTFDKRGEPLIQSQVTGVSDTSGRIEFDVVGHTLRRDSVVAPMGYRHFYEEFEGSVSGRIIPSTYGYLLSSWGDLCYKSDKDHPAVFVFVKDGVKEVSALPCRGGFDSGNGKHWTLNKPAWPKKPSLPDVVQKRPNTQPTTQP